ncbi:MAG: type IV secretory system conjugative DNA transfer family protein, partial [Pirellula sp.]
PNKLESHRRIIRLWVATLMAAITCRKQIPHWPTLFLLDEAAQLGHFPSFLQAMTLGRGYGIRVHSFWQDLSQLMTCYPTEWRTIINNCGVKQTFGLTDTFMAQGLDDLFQLPTSEITRLNRREQLLLLNGKTVRCTKLDYLRDRRFTGMFDDNPYHGGAWPELPAEDAREPRDISLREIAQRNSNDDENDPESGAACVPSR